MKKNKKAVLQQLASLIVPLVAIGIVLVVGFLIMSEVQDQVEANPNAGVDSFASNGTNDTINAIADIPGWLPIIVITIIGAILIGLVATFGRMR